MEITLRVPLRIRDQPEPRILFSAQPKIKIPILNIGVDITVDQEERLITLSRQPRKRFAHATRCLQWLIFSGVEEFNTVAAAITKMCLYLLTEPGVVDDHLSNTGAT